MAVNSFPFVLNFKSVDGKKYRKYISGENIPGGLIQIPHTVDSYKFLNTDAFKTDVLIEAFEVDTTKENFPIVQKSSNTYKIKSIYNSVNDSETINILSTLGTLEASQTKNISSDRSYELSFITPISTEGFLQFGDIGEIKPIINLSGTNTTTTNTDLFNSDGTINIDYAFSGIGQTVGGSDFYTVTTNPDTGLPNSYNAPPIISNPQVVNITDTTARITWSTNYPSDAQVFFLNGECPLTPISETSNELQPLEMRCETPTSPPSDQYSAENLRTDHTIDVFRLKPDTTYTILLKSKFPAQALDKISDVVFTYPDKILRPTEQNITFRTEPAPPPPPIDPIEDILFFEVLFAGNQKDSPEMYFDELKEEPRVSLNFDYNQNPSSKEVKLIGPNGRLYTKTVDITNPILNQKIELFGNTDLLRTSKAFIESTSNLNLGFILNEEFENDLEGEPIFLRDSLYYSVDVSDSEIADGDFSISENDIATSADPNKKWKKIIVDEGNSFIIPAKELLRQQPGENGNRLIIVSLYKKRSEYPPKINILDKDGLTFQVPFSEKDLERIIEIPYDGLQFANGAQIYIGETTAPKKTIRLTESTGSINLSYKSDFSGLTGEKIVQIAPIFVSGDEIKTRGESTSFNIKIEAVDDYPNLLSIRKPNTLRIRSYGNYNINYSLNIGATVETNYVDVDLLVNGIKVNLARLSPIPQAQFSQEVQGPVQFAYTFNIKEKIQNPYPILLNKKRVDLPDGTYRMDSPVINLVLTPYSTKKISDPLYQTQNEIKGLEYPITTTIIEPELKITLPQVKALLLDAFVYAFNINSPKENKYISHLANFGNDNQILISSWENDNYTLSKKSTDEAGNEIITDEVKSIILKLYNPLPANILDNTTLWITKLLANPIVETVVVREDIPLSCPPLRGPNFKIPVNYIVGQSTGFQSLDSLIISSSVSSSASLIQEYLSKGAIDDSGLNVQYVSGSITEATVTYLWDNFVHFSSAKERIDNFVYKVQLIELYENAISSSNYDPTSTGYTNSFTVKRDVELQTEKKNKIIGGFDGFEKFLYQYSSDYTTNDSTSITWPYNAGVRMASTSNTVSDWYDNVIVLAEEFDKENKNALVQNIPSYIFNNEENDQLLLFINMIGQHFDLIYYFNKAIERSRGANYSSKNGIANKLLYDKLKSFNWDAKNLAANSQLWEYLLGLDTNGNTKNTKAAKDRNNEIWRRILNNLPYLLKHKGTKRAVHALLACYGIPSSNLSILEFGGPEPTGTTKSKYLIENISNAIKLETGSKVSTLWTNTALSRKPETVEIFIKPAYASNWTVVSGSGWSLTASGSTDSKYGRVFFKIGATNYLSSSVLPIFNNEYFGVSLTTITGSTNYTFGLDVAQYKGERQIFASSTTASVAAATATPWQTAGQIAIGGGFSGSVDEFRLWNTALDTDIFYEHVAFPEMVNGNHISSSTQDLFFRLDFEYPKNVNTYTTTPNVDNNIYYSQSLSRNYIETTSIRNGVNIFSETTPAIYSASFSGFTSVTSYPYQFEVIERNSALEMPDLGIQRYSTNKIRFESQTLEGNILYKDQRNTTRAFDNAPIDSNKLGLFFSPTKELNIDIAKSFGGLNLDDYIGDPRDQYNDRYVSLDRLREYYFNRFDGRDIYAYINLVKMYEQNLFEDIKQLLPARAKVTTGILIEPHILERSKIARKKPSGENNQYETSIEYNLQENVIGETSQYETTIDNRDTTQLISDATQYEGDISTEMVFNLQSEASQYEGTISTEDFSNIDAEATQYEGDIDTRAKDPSVQAYIDWLTQTIGASTLEDYGLGLFMQKPGVALRNYIDEYGFVKKERVRVNLLTRQYQKFYEKYKERLPNGLADFRGGTEVTSSLVTERILSIQPFAGTTNPTVKGEIIEVTPVFGYLPTHYKYTQDNSTGLQNSFYKGCKLSGICVIDGKPVVEEFIGNPGTLKVNKFGRDANEPILEVE